MMSDPHLEGRAGEHGHRQIERPKPEAPRITHHQHAARVRRRGAGRHAGAECSRRAIVGTAPRLPRTGRQTTICPGPAPVNSLLELLLGAGEAVGPPSR